VSELLEEKLEEKLELKFNEKLSNFITKEDAKQFATKDDLKRELKKFATKDDLGQTEERIMTNTARGFNEFRDQMQTQMDYRFDRVDGELAKRPTRDELQRWSDANTDNVKKDIKRLKYLQKKEWKDLPALSTINRSLSRAKIN